MDYKFTHSHGKNNVDYALLNAAYARRVAPKRLEGAFTSPLPNLQGMATKVVTL